MSGTLSCLQNENFKSMIDNITSDINNIYVLGANSQTTLIRLRILKSW